MSERDLDYVNLDSGWRRSAQEFGLFAEAYHRAARRLGESWRGQPTFQAFDSCPIVFLYRHATELYLKGVLRAGSSLLSLSGQAPPFDASLFIRHELKPLLRHLRKIFDAMDWEGSYRDIEAFVEALDELDDNSFRFRYPVDTKNQPALSDRFGLNLQAFVTDAEASLTVLCNASYEIDDRRDNLAEALPYADEE